MTNGPSIHQLAQNAIDALAAFNSELDRQQTAWARSRYGRAFRGNGPSISIDQQIALLAEIVHYDAEPQETLDTLNLIDEPCTGRVELSDAEFDFASTRGLAA